MKDNPDNQKKPKMDKLSPPEKAHIEELLKSAMLEYSTRQRKHIKDREELFNRISSIISEFLGPYMLIGYDIKGEPFNIIHASSQMDMDAITTAMNKFILGSITNSNE